MKIETPYNKERLITLSKKGKLVAYILFRRVGKLKHGLFEITRIEVDKRYQKIGLATRLFNEMLKRMKYRKLFVTTHASNYIARNFYIKMGMKYEATLRNHYYNGENELIYSRLSDNSRFKKDGKTDNK